MKWVAALSTAPRIIALVEYCQILSSSIVELDVIMRTCWRAEIVFTRRQLTCTWLDGECLTIDKYFTFGYKLYVVSDKSAALSSKRKGMFTRHYTIFKLLLSHLWEILLTAWYRKLHSCWFSTSSLPSQQLRVRSHAIIIRCVANEKVFRVCCGSPVLEQRISVMNYVRASHVNIE